MKKHKKYNTELSDQDMGCAETANPSYDPFKILKIQKIQETVKNSYTLVQNSYLS